jgi:hypothetical protein
VGRSFGDSIDRAAAASDEVITCGDPELGTFRRCSYGSLITSLSFGENCSCESDSRGGLKGEWDGEIEEP